MDEVYPVSVTAVTVAYAGMLGSAAKSEAGALRIAVKLDGGVASKSLSAICCKGDLGVPIVILPWQVVWPAFGPLTTTLQPTVPLTLGFWHAVRGKSAREQMAAIEQVATIATTRAKDEDLVIKRISFLQFRKQTRDPGAKYSVKFCCVNCLGAQVWGRRTPLSSEFSSKNRPTSAEARFPDAFWTAPAQWNQAVAIRRNICETRSSDRVLADR